MNKLHFITIYSMQLCVCVCVYIYNVYIYIYIMTAIIFSCH